MIYPKQSPVGIDKYVEALAAMLNVVLSQAWDMADGAYASYGRCYRNQAEKGYTAEVFRGGTDYKDAGIDDGLSASSFWFVAENTPIDALSAQSTATISVIFFVNLKKIKPTIAHRADEEARLDVERALRNYPLTQQVIRQVTGIGNVFKEFDGWKIANGDKFRDYHPFHCFRFDMTIKYSPLNC